MTTMRALRSPAILSATMAAVMPEPMMQMSLSTTRLMMAHRRDAAGRGVG
jgi:hypothetical protein